MELSRFTIIFVLFFSVVTAVPANKPSNTVLTCRGDEFRCDNTRCVPEFVRCDGTPDCADGTDERNCKGTRVSRDVKCEVEPSDAIGPVCGSDGVTYSSHAALRCANNTEGISLEVVYRGKCEDPCWQAISPLAAQSKEEEKVCASDLTIYPNANVLACVNLHSSKANLSVIEMEKCTNEDKKFDPCLLLAYVAPRKVCGSDNVTYTNIWHMICTANMYKVDDLKLQHEGECNIECPYSPIYNPVCSTIEYMYANVEALKCRQILSPYIKNEFHHHGHCARHLNKNPCYVDNAYNPVCASNGRTYSSPQYVRCLKKSNAGLSVLHSGPCGVEEVRKIVGETESCAIASHHYEWNPVCASDNVTYGNPFIFICTALNKTQGDLEVVHKGECGSFDYCRLNETAKEEVCGNDGITYDNINALYCAQSTKRHLQLSHSGACKGATDDPCLFRGSPFLDNNGTPVCASNGVTYVSPQAAWCETKTDRGIEFKHDGECF